MGIVIHPQVFPALGTKYHPRTSHFRVAGERFLVSGDPGAKHFSTALERIGFMAQLITLPQFHTEAERGYTVARAYRELGIEGYDQAVLLSIAAPLNP